MMSENKETHLKSMALLVFFALFAAPALAGESLQNSVESRKHALLNEITAEQVIDSMACAEVLLENRSQAVRDRGCSHLPIEVSMDSIDFVRKLVKFLGDSLSAIEAGLIDDLHSQENLTYIEHVLTSLTSMDPTVKTLEIPTDDLLRQLEDAKTLYQEKQQQAR